MNLDSSIFNQGMGNIYTGKLSVPNNMILPQIRPDSLFTKTNPLANPLETKPPTQALFLSQTLDIKSVANSMIKIIDAKDSYTGKHSKAVQKYAGIFTKMLGFSDEESEFISVGSAFHDIGKISVPESILNSNGPLTDKEFEKVKQHAEIGCKILEGMPAFSDVASKIVRSHHESWDGSGYPDNLSGENIPTGARIVAIVDSYHAMTSNRPYRKGMPTDEAIRRLNNGAGTQWDPKLVKEFIKISPMM